MRLPRSWRTLLASLLGINAPAQAMGRVLTEALPAPRKAAPAPAGDAP